MILFVNFMQQRRNKILLRKVYAVAATTKIYQLTKKSVFHLHEQSVHRLCAYRRLYAVRCMLKENHTKEKIETIQCIRRHTNVAVYVRFPLARPTVYRHTVASMCAYTLPLRVRSNRTWQRIHTQTMQRTQPY